MNQDKIRNIAIIAHVDHGKTTLVDAFLKQTHVFRENQEEMTQTTILDTGDLEREKGITIKAKNIAVEYKGFHLNIIDTPGHADFGGEVERTLNMADGCLVIVDAQEGPMPQTRFVLKKAFENKLKTIVVINKIDKPAADLKKTLSKIQDLFLSIATEDDQLEFPVFYAIARDGKIWEEVPQDFSSPTDIRPLLEKIIEYIPAPKGDISKSFQLQITSVDYDAHVGNYLIGKIKNGKVKIGDNLVVSIPGSESPTVLARGKVKQLFIKKGLALEEIEEAGVGEIIAIVGIDSREIGATVTDSNDINPLPLIEISEPSVRIKVEANTSPFVGKDGEFVTAKQLQQRLEQEAMQNIALSIEKTDQGAFYISGRGDLQLSILLEELRREGFEMQVRRPEVITKMVDGKKFEPIENLFIDVPEEYQGTILTSVSNRKGELITMESEGDRAIFHFKILTSNLLGLRNILITETKGNLIMNHSMIEYVEEGPKAKLFRQGVLISSDTGVCSAYALNTIQERGTLFVTPATEVYEGMIIGINKYEEDLEVNPTKERAKSGVRRNQAEITQIQLKAPQQLTMEFAFSFLAKDEILEITPHYLRLRKKYLTKTERIWSKRKKLSEIAKQNLHLN